MDWFLWFAVFLVTIGLTYVAKRVALRNDIMDVPNARSSHQAPVPRGGGMAVAAGVLGGVWVLSFLSSMPAPLVFTLLVGGVAVTAVGYVDDLGHVPAIWRILVHFSAIFFALYLLATTPLFSKHWVVLYPSLALLLVWLLNLYNFMDGIDGLAAMETITTMLGAVLLVMTTATASEGVTGVFAQTCLIVVAASCGFLVLNWPPATIFMGDSGSGFLGFVVGVLALWSVVAGLLSAWSWAVLLAVFIVDATFTLARRMVRGETWYAPHRTHAYQHAAQRWGHKAVTIGVTLINVLWLWPLAWMVETYPEGAAWITVGGYLPLVGVVVWLGAGKGFGELNYEKKGC